MTKKNPPSNSETALFYENMADIKRLKIKHPKVRLKRKSTTRTITQPPPVKETLIPDADPNYSIPSVTSETQLSYKHSSISNKILRNLSKGQYNVDAILDLHGLTVAKAKTALDQFLHDCLNEQCRVILIVHGKSKSREKPILKNKLNEWLRQVHAVLAFCSATSSHGSRGAVYVLLRRHTEESMLG